MNEFINRFLTENTSAMKMWRTIVQGVLGVLVAYLDQIVGVIVIEPSMRPIVVALVMAILAPIMSELGKNLKEIKE